MAYVVFAVVNVVLTAGLVHAVVAAVVTASMAAGCGWAVVIDYCGDSCSICLMVTVMANKMTATMATLVFARAIARAAGAAALCTVASNALSCYGHKLCRVTCIKLTTARPGRVSSSGSSPTPPSPETASASSGLSTDAAECSGKAAAKFRRRITPTFIRVTCFSQFSARGGRGRF